MDNLLRIIYSFRKLFFVLAFITISLNLSAQSLLESRKTSYFTYVYQLKNKEVKEFLTNSNTELPNHYFHTLIDSFPTDSVFKKNLGIGHFLFLRAIKNKLDARLVSNNSFKVDLFNNERDLILSINDLEKDEPITNAIVTLKNKPIKYNKATKTYTLSKSNRKGFVSVQVGNEMVFYEINRKKSNPRIKQFLKTVSRSFPLKYVTPPFTKIYYAAKHHKKLFPKKSSYFKGKGYVILNKPKYFPIDTIKWKAFIVDKKGNPYTEQVKVVIKKTYRGKKQKGKLVNYTTKGAYIGQIVLKDSLSLGYYTIEIWDSELKHELVSNFFLIEDYQLDETTYKVRTDKKNYFSGEKINLYLSGKDVNGLNLMDSRVSIELTTARVNKYLADTVFVANQLWGKEFLLDPVGETKITIPTNDFPKANINITARIKFNNSNNETHSEILHFRYSGINKRIESSLKNDSIYAQFMVDNKSVNAIGTVIGLNKKDTVFNRKIYFPVKEKINNQLDKYLFTVGKHHKTITNDDIVSKFNCTAYRTSDSVYFTVNNPRKLDFSYIIYKNGNKIIDKGNTITFHKSIADKSDASYFISCHYIFGGESFNPSYSAHLFTKKLKVKIDQPSVIYPGKKVNVKIKILDVDDKPVKNVNVTAGAINAKFKRDNIPNAPYLSKYRKRRRERLNYFRIHKKKANKFSLISNSFYHKMRLDTIPFYHFTYPKNKLILKYKSINFKKAQFASFLFNKGKETKINLIYIDNHLIYYSETDNNKVYAFIADSGYHQVKLRTSNREYIMDSVLLKNGYKLDFSFNPTTPPKKVKQIEKPNQLTTEETKLLDNSLLFLRNNFRYRNGYIGQGEHTDKLIGQSKDYVLGPYLHDSIHFTTNRHVTINFVFEPGYEYTLKKDVIKLVKTEKKFTLGTSKINHFLGQVYQSPLSKLKPKKKNHWSKYINDYNGSYATKSKTDGTLIYQYLGDTSFCLIRLSRLGSISEGRIYRGNTHQFYNLTAGWYQMLLVSCHNNYMLRDSIYIQPDGKNFIRLNDANLQKADSLYQLTNYNEINHFNYNYNANGVGTIQGKIVDENTDEPLPFVNITLEQNGKVIGGGITDFDGFYRITNAPAGKFDMKVQFGGYQPKVVTNLVIKPNRTFFYDVLLSSSIESLETFEVVRYKVPLIDKDGGATGRTVTREEIGKMATRAATGIAATVGGVSSFNVPPTTASPPPSDSKEANHQSVNSIRSNFKDYGYWQPNLITDKNGEVAFNVSFPDNVTKWKSYAIAMNGNKQSGTGFAETKSYKQLLGQLATPRFLIERDQTNIIGKIMNYTATPEKVISEFNIDEKLVTKHDTMVTHAVINYQKVIAPTSDSLKILYTVTKQNGYIDGEQREIPIFPIGMQTTKGTFKVLKKDTIVNLTFEDSSSTIKLYAASNSLTPLLDELKKLQDYPYQCMEQTASKLTGLLLEKQIKEKLKQPFQSEQKIKKLIKKLTTSQKKDGSWGWWPNSTSNIWMTNYVVNALFEAKKMKYRVTKLENTIDFLNWKLDVMTHNELLTTLNTLSNLEIPVAYKNYLQQIEKDTLIKKDILTDYQKMIILKIKQEQHSKISLKEIIKEVKSTYMGNYYWGIENNSWFDNSNNLTLLAYKILETKDSLHPYLSKIRNYFMEVKGQNKWNNTINQAQVIRTILPGLMREYKNDLRPAKLLITSVEKREIEHFPYQYTFPKGTKSLQIQKTGNFPIYLTTYQKYWNTIPTYNDSLFEIKTWFEKDEKVLDSLKVGSPVELKVQVISKKKGRYLMLEVPIPAGCSYDNNRYSKSYIETHREYYKQKTNIYIESLNKGKYTFSIKLQPRFSGKYTLNPSKIELMYFPSFNGNNNLKETIIN